MSVYDKIKELNIDLSPLGIHCSETGERYYCTPEDAEVFGWAGVDGIHYCTIPQFGEMIFAVSPMNFGDCVHPIAGNFDALIALLLSCKSMDALEQCYAWDREQYDAYLQGCEVSDEQEEILKKLKRKLKLQPVKDVFSYVKRLQEGFDYLEIPYSEDYYDTNVNPNAPARSEEWGVTFEGGFWNQEGECGQEVRIDQSFNWGDERWTVAAAYLCKEGLVVDYTVEIELARLNAFFDKWKLREDGYEQRLRLEQEQIESEHPMNFGFRSKLLCNGTVLESGSGSSICWVPLSCRGEVYAQDLEARHVMRHYELNRKNAWVLWRCSYRWEQRETQIRTLEISLERERKRYAVSPIGALEMGDTVEIENPVTGQKFTLTASELTSETFDQSIFRNPSLDYPTHVTVLAYHMEPEPEGASFALQDANEGDAPRMREQSEDGSSAVAFSVIGGVRNGLGMSHQTACSSMHFDEDYEVNWMPVFFLKELEDIAVEVHIDMNNP